MLIWVTKKNKLCSPKAYGRNVKFTASKLHIKFRWGITIGQKLIFSVISSGKT